jgi:hypothetical protein
MSIRNSVAALATVLLVGCAGMEIYPRASGLDGMAPDPAAPGTFGGRSGGGIGAIGFAEAAIATVCRNDARRSGWVIVRYTIEGDGCPTPGDGENPYNGAIIERHQGRPAGTTLLICADQGVPRGWARDTRIGNPDACPGAKVREDRPTAFLITRTGSGQSR